jgi:hypothetical protein
MFPKMNSNLERAILLALILNSAIALSGFYARTYDSYGHMFFADHYQKNWFDTWETRWYLGFNVASYPPLAHQVLALVGFATGLETAYVFITILLMVLLPIGIFMFAKVFISEEAAGYTALLSVFFPGILYSVYVWGQYTTLFSLVLILFTGSAFAKYIRNGGRLFFVELIFLFEAVVASHHFSGLIFAPLLLGATFITLLIRKEISWKISTKRFILFLGVGLLLSTLIVYPVLFSAVSDNVNIPHPTTLNYLQYPEYFQRFFIDMYGFFLILIPFAAILIYYRRRKDLLPLLVLSLFLMVLGLGGSTILPQLVFGQNWLGLTYERFNLFAILTFAPLFGLVCFNLRKKKLGKSFLVILLVLCVLFSGWAANESVFRSRPDKVPVESLVGFLNRDDHWMWRYITLGFDASDICKLSVYSNATTLDGWYYRGRDIPELSNSGFGYFSDAKYEPNGLAVLTSVLDNASQYNLRFVFCNDPSYAPILNATGFSRLEEEYQQVTVWVKNDSGPLEINKIVNINHEATLLDYSWGIVPMTWLVGLFVLNIFKVYRNLKKSRASTFSVENIVSWAKS